MRSTPLAGQRVRAALVLSLTLVVSLGVSGCAFSREVTPWLRTSRSVPVRWMAESGGVGGFDTVHVERKEGGAWVTLHEDTDRAFAFAGGTRAVLGEKLVKPTGPLLRLPCDSEVRARPDASELVCVQSISRGGTKASSGMVRVKRIDRDGQVVDVREVAAPVKVADDEPILGDEVSTDWLGFVPEGLVFSVLTIAAKQSFASDAELTPRAFVLRPDGTWRELGSMTITVSELWALHFPRLWNERLDWHIQVGGILQDANGEPNP